MPDPALETAPRDYAEPNERTPVSRDKQPIDDTQGYHPFVESEFPEGAGCCDRCGGGPDAAIHQKPVDQMERIADALERIANILDVFEMDQHYRYERGGFWRMLDWLGNFFGGRGWGSNR